MVHSSNFKSDIIFSGYWVYVIVLFKMGVVVLFIKALVVGTCTLLILASILYPIV